MTKRTKPPTAPTGTFRCRRLDCACVLRVMLREGKATSAVALTRCLGHIARGAMELYSDLERVGAGWQCEPERKRKWEVEGQRK